ncbi:uncharacterized protein LOC126326582 isoform X2 [Schistocerca gregaria]|uniref:uncharacterized protein LOC126326582 isoform X2 n=1 Tax=Schistocerca gregaria TaxID=7010 RepID=UPI00211E5309|nr:uncharacterized protein LOC126326582 isoform X2 [Schistocerca gregaria]
MTPSSPMAPPETASGRPLESGQKDSEDFLRSSSPPHPMDDYEYMKNSLKNYKRSRECFEKGNLQNFDLIKSSKKHSIDSRTLDFTMSRYANLAIAKLNGGDSDGSPVSRDNEQNLMSVDGYRAVSLSGFKRAHKSKIPVTPLAEKIRKIDISTPEHWKCHQLKDGASKPLELTHPIDPTLQTAIRSMSRSSCTARLDPAPVQSFKAMPLSKRIFESKGDLGVPRVFKKPLTVPCSPKLHVASRLMAKTVHVQCQKGDSHSAMHESDASRDEHCRDRAKPREDSQHTDPLSKCFYDSQCELSGFGFSDSQADTKPKLHIKRTKSSSALQLAGCAQFKKGPVTLEMCQQELECIAESHRVNGITVPKPFSLMTEQRYLEKESRLSETCKRRKQEEPPPSFHANPTPQFSKPFHPKLEFKVTEVNPFSLRSLERHELAHQKLKQKFAEFQTQQLKALKFKAQPFKPARPLPIAKSTKPLTLVSDFVLNTETRSVSRREFEMKKQEKDKLLMEEAKCRAALEAQRHQAMLKQVRAEIVHKPLAVPNALYRPPPPPKPSDKPLTEAKTPNLRTKNRSLLR